MLKWRTSIPWSMVVGRTALGPAIAFIAAEFAHPELWLGLMIAAGFFSDIYDGILARRWGTESNALRTYDSVADTIFYFGILAAIIARERPVLAARIDLIAALLALEVTRWLFDWIKFRRMASYHSYASKFWGILLAAAAIALLCFHAAFWLVTVAIVWGILCDLEGLAMSILLPEWKRDVRNLKRAWILRKQIISTAAHRED